MKILFLTPWYPDEVNKNHGIFIREQAVALATRHEVVVISSKVNYKKIGFASSTITESNFQNVKEYRLTINRSLLFYNQLNYFFISTKTAVKIARTFKPDVIHGNIGYPGGFWSWLVSKRINKPFIITEHTFIYNNFRSFIHKKLTLFSLRKAAEVITVSSKSAAEIKKHVNRDVQVVANIVDTSCYSIAHYPRPPIAIGFLGGLSSPKHVKGLDILLKVTSSIKMDFILYVGGAGAMIDSYKAMASHLKISEKCKFLEYIKHEEVSAFMNQLHFFANTSRFESFGVAIAEAMASGLPVVCFDNGGPADFVNQSNGILVENKNEEKLKEAIEWMMDHYLTFDREKIRASVVNRFSKISFVDSMDSIYKSVIGE